MKKQSENEGVCMDKSSIWYGMTKKEIERLVLFGKLPPNSAKPVYTVNEHSKIVYGIVR